MTNLQPPSAAALVVLDIAKLRNDVLIEVPGSRRRLKLAKRGNARLRRTLWMATQVALRQPENSFCDKCERYVAKDRFNADL